MAYLEDLLARGRSAAQGLPQPPPVPRGLESLAGPEPMPSPSAMPPMPGMQPDGMQRIGQRLDTRLGELGQNQSLAPGMAETAPQSQGMQSLLAPYSQAVTAAPTTFGQTQMENTVADRIAEMKGVNPSGTGPGVGGLLSVAKTQIGVPYVFGSENPQGSQGGQGAAFDCSGFTKWLAAKKGIQLPHQALQQAQVTGSNLNRKQLRPGDLVYFSYGRLGAGAIDHVMVYMGNSRAIGAQPSSSGVGIQPMNWSAFVGGGRLGGGRRRR